MVLMKSSVDSYTFYKVRRVQHFIPFLILCCLCIILPTLGVRYYEFPKFNVDHLQDPLKPITSPIVADILSKEAVFIEKAGTTSPLLDPATIVGPTRRTAPDFHEHFVSILDYIATTTPTDPANLNLTEFEIKVLDYAGFWVQELYLSPAFLYPAYESDTLTNSFSSAMSSAIVNAFRFSNFDPKNLFSITYLQHYSILTLRFQVTPEHVEMRKRLLKQYKDLTQYVVDILYLDTRELSSFRHSLTPHTAFPNLKPSTVRPNLVPHPNPLDPPVASTETPALLTVFYAYDIAMEILTNQMEITTDSEEYRLCQDERNGYIIEFDLIGKSFAPLYIAVHGSAKNSPSNGPNSSLSPLSTLTDSYGLPLGAISSFKRSPGIKYYAVRATRDIAFALLALSSSPPPRSKISNPFSFFSLDLDYGRELFYGPETSDSEGGNSTPKNLSEKASSDSDSSQNEPVITADDYIDIVLYINLYSLLSGSKEAKDDNILDTDYLGTSTFYSLSLFKNRPATADEASTKNTRKQITIVKPYTQKMPVESIVAITIPLDHNPFQHLDTYELFLNPDYKKFCEWYDHESNSWTNSGCVAVTNLLETKKDKRFDPYNIPKYCNCNHITGMVRVAGYLADKDAEENAKWVSLNRETISENPYALILVCLWIIIVIIACVIAILVDQRKDQDALKILISDWSLFTKRKNFQYQEQEGDEYHHYNQYNQAQSVDAATLNNLSLDNATSTLGFNKNTPRPPAPLQLGSSSPGSSPNPNANASGSASPSNNNNRLSADIEMVSLARRRSVTNNPAGMRILSNDRNISTASEASTPTSISTTTTISSTGAATALSNSASTQSREYDARSELERLHTQPGAMLKIVESDSDSSNDSDDDPTGIVFVKNPMVNTANTTNNTISAANAGTAAAIIAASAPAANTAATQPANLPPTFYESVFYTFIYFYYDSLHILTWNMRHPLNPFTSLLRILCSCILGISPFAISSLLLGSNRFLNHLDATVNNSISTNIPRYAIVITITILCTLVLHIFLQLTIFLLYGDTYVRKFIHFYTDELVKLFYYRESSYFSSSEIAMFSKSAKERMQQDAIRSQPQPRKSQSQPNPPPPTHHGVTRITINLPSNSNSNSRSNQSTPQTPSKNGPPSIGPPSIGPPVIGKSSASKSSADNVLSAISVSENPDTLSSATISAANGIPYCDHKTMLYSFHLIATYFTWRKSPNAVVNHPSNPNPASLYNIRPIEKFHIPYNLLYYSYMLRAIVPLEYEQLNRVFSKRHGGLRRSFVSPGHVICLFLFIVIALSLGIIALIFGSQISLLRNDITIGVWQSNSWISFLLFYIIVYPIYTAISALVYVTYYSRTYGSYGPYSRLKAIYESNKSKGDTTSDAAASTSGKKKRNSNNDSIDDADDDDDSDDYSDDESTTSQSEVYNNANSKKESRVLANIALFEKQRFSIPPLAIEDTRFLALRPILYNVNLLDPKYDIKLQEERALKKSKRKEKKRLARLAAAQKKAEIRVQKANERAQKFIQEQNATNEKIVHTIYQSSNNGTSSNITGSGSNVVNGLSISNGASRVGSRGSRASRTSRFNNSIRGVSKNVLEDISSDDEFDYDDYDDDDNDDFDSEFRKEQIAMTFLPDDIDEEEDDEKKLSGRKVSGGDSDTTESANTTDYTTDNTTDYVTGNNTASNTATDVHFSKGGNHDESESEGDYTYTGRVNIVGVDVDEGDEGDEE